MIPEIVLYTDSEVSNLMFDSAVFGVTVGLLFGMFIAFGFTFFLKNVFNRNYKMFLLSLKDDDRDKLDDHVKDLYDTLEELCNKTNSKVFKQWFNDVCSLRAYLKLKFNQN